MDDPVVTELLERPGSDGEEARLGLLTAIADASPNRKLVRLLVALETRSGPTREWTKALARAAAAQRALTLVPALISRLAQRDGRRRVREALVTLGPPAMDEVWGTLVDTSRERRLRAHLPNTLARFGTTMAAELPPRVHRDRAGRPGSVQGHPGAGATRGRRQGHRRPRAGRATRSREPRGVLPPPRPPGAVHAVGATRASGADREPAHRAARRQAAAVPRADFPTAEDRPPRRRPPSRAYRRPRPTTAAPAPTPGSFSTRCFAGAIRRRPSGSSCWSWPTSCP